MTVSEIYAIAGGGYEEILAKFRSDATVSVFLKMFVKDNSYNELCEMLAAGDCEGAFGAVHNLKGLVLNLNFKGLIAPVCEVTEALRVHDMSGAKAAMPVLTAAYNYVVEAINSL